MKSNKILAIKIGIILYELRITKEPKIKGISQFSNFLGLQERTLRKYELGESIPSFEKLLLISKKLGVPFWPTFDPEQIIL